ncbi:MAG: sugar phosphate isomerase/epimerase [Bryobacteraceae bacterium]|nr:sugar phosphate isomerase/epimerase [Bryobacteraceae bacterium]
MDHVLSTHLFQKHRLSTALLDRILAAGIPAVEIFVNRQHLDYLNKAQINELASWFRDAKLQLWALHSPMYSDDQNGRSGPNATIAINEPVKNKRVVMVDEVKRALEIAEQIPCRYLVQHLGVPYEEFDERRVDAAFSSLEELNSFARQRGVEILLENIPNGFSNASKLNYFTEVTHLSNGYCFDSGHAQLYAHSTHGHIDSEFELMRPRIRSSHLHDNNGVEDTHRFPFLHSGGTIDWRRMLELFRACPGQFPLNLELKESDDFPQPLDSIRTVFEKLEQA